METEKLNQPLADRLTEDEKRKINGIYHYAKSQLETDKTTEWSRAYADRVDILESIFGTDIFGKKPETTKRTFHLKDNDGDVVKIVKLKDKIACHFVDRRAVVMGETDDNTFVIELKNPSDCGRYAHQGVHLTEGSLMAFFATMLVYFQNKGINPYELYKKYLPDNSNGSVPCWFEEFDDDTTDE